MCVSMATAALISAGLSAATSVVGGLSAAGAASAEAKAAQADAARKRDIAEIQAKEQANLAEQERQERLARNRAIAGMADIGDSASFNRIQAGITEDTMDDIAAIQFNQSQKSETDRLTAARIASNARAKKTSALVTGALGAASAALTGYTNYQKLTVPGSSGLTDAERYNKLDSGPRNRFYAT